MSKKLIVIGTGLFAEVASTYFNEFSQYKVEAFACHEKYKQGDQVYDLSLISIENLKDIYPPDLHEVFVAIGYGKMNKMRQRVYEEVKALGYTCATFVYPDVKIWNSTILGDNVFIFEDNTIQPFTKIGNNSILWSGNHIGHHSSIEEHCFLASHVVLSGSCTVGSNSFIGVNVTIHDSISIGNECLLGAGAIISKNTKPKTVYVPTATKVFPKNSEEIGF